MCPNGGTANTPQDAYLALAKHAAQEHPRTVSATSTPPTLTASPPRTPVAIPTRRDTPAPIAALPTLTPHPEPALHKTTPEHVTMTAPSPADLPEPPVHSVTVERITMIVPVRDPQSATAPSAQQSGPPANSNISPALHTAPEGNTYDDPPEDDNYNAGVDHTPPPTAAPNITLMENVAPTPAPTAGLEVIFSPLTTSPVDADGWPAVTAPDTAPTRPRTASTASAAAPPSVTPPTVTTGQIDPFAPPSITAP